MPASSHPQAEPAALTLLAAAERTDDDYWKTRAWLFANQRNLGPIALARFVEEAGLDRATVLGETAARKHRAEIQEDLAAARSVGITGTPSFVLGTSDGQIIRGERIIGSKSFALFESKIQALLAKAGVSATLSP
jgi:predicted DsbA family dithiol-disulfide isomerase